MILKYGAHAHANNEVSITIDRRPFFSERQFQLGITETWNIQGFLHGTSQANLTTNLATLKTAYDTNGLDLILFLDNGTTPTHHGITSSATMGGTKIIDRGFPTGVGAEYSTFRTFSITVSADFLSSEQTLLSYNENVSVVGTTGAKTILKQTLTGAAQKQQVAEQSIQRIIQAGRAIGSITYPAVASPLFPADELVDQRRLGKSGPRNTRGTLTHFTSTWQYAFEAVTDQSVSAIPSAL